MGAMNAKTPLLNATEVHDLNNLPLWGALTLAAGAVNATALAACQRFVSHVTGSLTRFGADYDSMRLFVEYGAVVGSFVLGAMTSFWALDGRRVHGKAPWVGLPLVLVSAVLVGVGVGGLAGLFGPFGLTVETTADFVMLALLSFAMGLQNAAIATTSGMIVRTTHMTGPLTDFSVALAAWVSPNMPADVRATAARSVKLRGVKLLGFVVGALLATVLAKQVGYAAFFFPAVVVLGAASVVTRVVQRSPTALAAA